MIIIGRLRLVILVCVIFWMMELFIELEGWIWGEDYGFGCGYVDLEMF